MAVGEAQQGVPGAEQQVQEEANAVEAVPVARGPQADGVVGPQGVEWQDEDDAPYRPTDEDEEILFGPPVEGARLRVPTQQPLEGPVPASLVRRLPALARAAADPAAPASLRALYALTVRRLENEMRASG